MNRTLVWLRNDLRLRDNEALYRAAERGEVMPVYCFDPRQFGEGLFGFPKTGAFRLRFLLETVADLRQNLQKAGATLMVRIGKPEEVLPPLAQAWQANALYYHRAAGTEEAAVEQAVNQAMAALEIRSFWGHSLYHTEDTPFKIEQTPDVFADFKNRLTFQTLVRNQYAAPIFLPYSAPLPEEGRLPTFQELGMAEPADDQRCDYTFRGGETTALARLDEYFWKRSALRSYRHTRQNLEGQHFSSRLSPYLALGCLSPRFLYSEILRYERQVTRNESTEWLAMELVWRDYYQFLALKHGANFFRRPGVLGADVDWKRDPILFNQWQTAQTGYPLLDAAMTELRQTGWLSAKGRQIAASFLTRNLGIDWRMGAAYFESQLLDYEPANNYGNWLFAAGLGSDRRPFHYLNIPVQGEKLDPQGVYVKRWLPILAKVPSQKIHTPHTLTSAEQKQACVLIGEDYPKPIVSLEQSAREIEKIFHRGLVLSGKKGVTSRIKRFAKDVKN